MKNNDYYINLTINEINNFLKTNNRNVWIDNDQFHLYVRKSKRYYNHKTIDCFDIASIEITTKGKGIFTKFLDRIEEEYEFNIFVESIQEKRLFSFLEKRNYVYYDNYSMLKLKNIKKC